MNIYREQHFPSLSDREFDFEAGAAVRLRGAVTELIVIVNQIEGALTSNDGQDAIDALRNAISTTDAWMNKVREAGGF